MIDYCSLIDLFVSKRDENATQVTFEGEECPDDVIHTIMVRSTGSCLFF